ncbi:hypothetical protein [Hansschlegelia sp.]|uniref:hypothetical protein n=1 Tax=Hansschlegelia sp. TaxID=2041892 RepID=UPI002C65C241|nr:hypothetical protein [Hansschlegelia sp.]HVI27631.1 hypothetical protein [Hansschlegelia sp.]
MATLDDFAAAIKRAYRDYVSQNIPATGANKPAKLDLRLALGETLVGILQDIINLGIQGDAITACAWPELTTSPGVRAGQKGEVIGAAEDAEHVDPITGAIVPDNGTYAWSEEPPGWRRISDFVGLTPAQVAGLTTLQAQVADLAPQVAELDASAEALASDFAALAPKAEKAIASTFGDDGLKALVGGYEGWPLLEVGPDAKGDLRPVAGVDPDGRQWRAVRGRWLPAGASFTDHYPLIGEWRALELDVAGRVIAGVDLNDVVYKTSPEGAFEQQSTVAGRITPAVYQQVDAPPTSWLNDPSVDVILLVYGQSYALGTTDDYAGSTPYNTTPRHPKLYMPGGAAALFPNGRSFSGYQPLIEQKFADERSVTVETLCSECGGYILDQLDARFGAGNTPRLIMGVHGEIARGWPYFMPGSVNWNAFMALVDNCVAASAAEGRRAIVGAVIFDQGQNDSAEDIRRWARTQRTMGLREAIERGVRERTGQSERVPLIEIDPCRGFYSEQWRAPEIALAAADAARQSPGLHVYVGAAYQHQHSATDGTHPTVQGHRTRGAAIGRAILEGVFGGGWIALQPKRWFMRSATVARVVVGGLDWGQTLAIEPPGVIIADDVANPLGAGKGFVARDAAGVESATDLVITSVALAGTSTPDTIKAGAPVDQIDITFAAAPGPGLQIICAGRRQAGGHHAGRARSAFRDDTSLTIAGVADPIRNFLSPWELT